MSYQHDWQAIAAVAIFLFTYAIVAFQRIPRLRLDRPGGALTGAVLMVVAGVLSFDEAWSAVDSRTIVLLLGMMILNVFLEECGFFELCCDRVLAQAPSPTRLLVALVFLSGVLSALFLNDTVCLMLTPPVVTIVRRSGLSPTPYLIALAMSANVGSVMTITGNPQNMLIGVYSGYSYAGFALRMIPVGLVGMVALTAVLLRSYRGQLRIQPEKPAALVPPWNREPNGTAPHRRLMEKTLWVLGVVLTAFVIVGELPMMAMAGAVGLLIWSRRPPARILQRVNWVLLLFFAGLFIVVHGLEKSGLVARASAALAPCYTSVTAPAVTTFAVVTVAASNIVSNVPFVVLVRDLVGSLPDAPPFFWLVLAMASTFAGNLTIPGSVATLIVLESAEERGAIGFYEFLRVGAVVTAATVFLGLVVLALEQWLLRAFLSV